MRFPTRSETHVDETKSVRALEARIPAQWLVRHVTERDYGVDCLVEMVPPTGEVRGEMVAIQLKSVAEITWSSLGDGLPRRATVSGIATSTVNYWMGLPMPVFLVVHDRGTDRLYASDVKRQVRQSYSKLETHQTMSFYISESFELSNPTGLGVFTYLYFREKVYPGFSAALMDLTSNLKYYSHFVMENLDFDTFMEVDPDRFITFVRLYRGTQTLSVFGAIDANLPSIYEWIVHDTETFGEQWVLFARVNFDRALRELAPVYLDALKRGRTLVLHEERSFWEVEDPLLVRYVESSDADNALG